MVRIQRTRLIAMTKRPRERRNPIFIFLRTSQEMVGKVDSGVCKYLHMEIFVSLSKKNGIMSSMASVLIQ